MNWKKYKFHYRTFEVNEKGRIRNESGKILKGTLHRNGFRSINLRLKGERELIIYQSLLIHRVVAECFVENPENKPFVIHEDGNLLNNKAKNLQWATQEEKLQHQKEIGRYGNNKLSTKDAMQIKRLLNKKEQTINHIAKEFNVSHTQIHRIKKGENWQSCLNPPEATISSGL